MSVLRLLHGSKDPYGPSKPGSSSSSSKNPGVPSLVLDIPTYGAVFMNPPEDPLLPTLQEEEGEKPRNDVVIHGELVITMPPSLGRRRVKSIRVGIRSILTLNLKPGRMNEEDVLFERSVELAECGSCFCWLNTGTTIFDFTLIIPANHPPHDWHNNGTLRHFLYAEIEGQPKSNNSTPGFLSLRAKSKGPGSKSPAGHRTPKRGNSPPGSRSASPAPSPPLDTALLNQTFALSLDSDIKVLAPSYDESVTPPGGASTPSTTTASEDWLKGTYKTQRTLMLVYNPSPTGEVTILNLDFTGIAESLAIWSLQLDSNPVRLAGNSHLHRKDKEAYIVVDDMRSAPHAPQPHFHLSPSDHLLRSYFPCSNSLHHFTSRRPLERTHGIDKDFPHFRTRKETAKRQSLPEARLAGFMAWQRDWRERYRGFGY